MSSATLYRASGLSLILGAVLGIIGSILTAALFPGNDPHQYLTPLHTVALLVSMMGDLLLLLGFPSICVRQAEHAGWLGFIGFILAFLGGSLLTGFSVIELLILPWLAQVAPQLAAGNGPPALLVYLLVASVLYALGSILLGIAVMRAGILPRWAGLLLVIGAVLNAVDVPLTGIPGAIGASVAYVLFAVGLGWIGYALMTERRPEAIQSASAPAKIAG